MPRMQRQCALIAIFSCLISLGVANGATIQEIFGGGRTGFVPQGKGDSTEQVFEEFIQWAYANGLVNKTKSGDFSVRPLVEDTDANEVHFEGEFPTRPDVTLIPSEDIPLHATFFSPNRSMVVTSDDALGPSDRFPDSQMPYMLPVPQGSHPLLPQVALGAWILRERAKGPASTWAPYIRSLPEYVPLPSLFSLDLLLMLELGPVIMKVATARAALDAEYAKCSAEAIAHASLDEFLWSMSIVTSRAFGIPRCSTLEKEGEDEVKGMEKRLFCSQFGQAVMLVPIADLPNHSANLDQLSCEFKVRRASFELTAMVPVPTGQPLYISYGNYSSVDTLTGYGFVPDWHNPMDEVVMFRGFPELAGFFSGFMQMVSRNNAEFKDTKGMTSQEDWAAANAAVDAMGKHRSYQERGLSYVEQRQDFLMLGNGKPDLQLLATFSALWLWAKGRLTEGHFAHLADATAKFSDWLAPVAPCSYLSTPASADEQGRLQQEAISATIVGLAASRLRLQDLHSAFTTTLEQDVTDLNRLRRCKGFKVEDLSDGGDSSCTAQEMAQFKERELIYKFRIAQKKTMKAAMASLDKLCWAEYSELLQGIVTKVEEERADGGEDKGADRVCKNPGSGGGQCTA